MVMTGGWCRWHWVNHYWDDGFPIGIHSRLWCQLHGGCCLHVISHRVSYTMSWWLEIPMFDAWNDTFCHLFPNVQIVNHPQFKCVMDQTGKTMNRCCWYKPQVMLLVFPPPFSNSSQDLVDSRIKLWAPRSVPGLSDLKDVQTLLIFHAWNFVVSLCFFKTFTVIILWCVGVLSSLSRWKQTHGGDVLQWDHLETSLCPIFWLKNHHFSYWFLKELVNSPGPGNQNPSRGEGFCCMCLVLMNKQPHGKSRGVSENWGKVTPLFFNFVHLTLGLHDLMVQILAPHSCVQITKQRQKFPGRIVCRWYCSLKLEVSHVDVGIVLVPDGYEEPVISSEFSMNFAFYFYPKKM